MLKMLIPLSVALTAALVVGWVNLHTDEPTVVLAFALPLVCALSFAWPRMKLLWGILLGASVPASQLFVLRLGWRTPYPNTRASIRESCIVLLLTIAVALIAGYIRVSLFPPSAPSAAGSQE